MALIRNKVKPDGRPYLNPEDELDVNTLTEDTIVCKCVNTTFGDVLEAVRMGSHVDVRAVVENVVGQVDGVLFRLVHSLDTDMTGDDDDGAALFAEPLDGAVIRIPL